MTSVNQQLCVVLHLYLQKTPNSYLLPIALIQFHMLDLDKRFLLIGLELLGDKTTKVPCILGCSCENSVHSSTYFIGSSEQSTKQLKDL